MPTLYNLIPLSAAFRIVPYIANGIKWVLEHEDRLALSDACVKKVQENYTEEVVTKQYTALYERASRSSCSKTHWIPLARSILWDIFQIHRQWLQLILVQTYLLSLHRKITSPTQSWRRWRVELLVSGLK